MASPRGNGEAATPICRCRVLYLGSAVPHASKDGLQGIQGPLRELYPEGGARGARGIDSWLSVWSNGLLLENVDENRQEVTRFFPIASLHYCAAVRHVLVPEKGASQSQPRFLPLDSPFASAPSPLHPPLFAAILRRTTGIKVLECHAFICKREAAANALVRCCFHAYADSSYAKHIDGAANGSVYGTLRGSAAGNGEGSNSIEKVEGWRQAHGSSLSLSNGHNGTLDSRADFGAEEDVDDISVYNGDENHKVWAGREDEGDRDGVYASYGATMRSTRAGRPRQIQSPVQPPPPPPPPPPKEDGAKKKAAKERMRRKKMLGGSREELYNLRGGGSLVRGATMQTNGHARPHSSLSGREHMQALYSNGSLLRPGSGPPPPPHPHPAMLMTLPPPPRPHLVAVPAPGKRSGTYKSGKGQPMTLGPPVRYMMPGPPMAPHLGPPVGPPPPMHVSTMGRRKPMPGIAMPHHPLEEPIYMPSARPLSPVASYQPGHFPHEAYLMQQYATATLDGRGKKKNKKNKKNGAIPMAIPVPIPVPGPMPPMVMMPSHNGGGSSMSPPPVNGINGNATNGTNGGSPDGGEDSSPVEESPFNTGIYRKKGHLNERAFSYSIRQEHRSRSHGSLASLQFGPGPPEHKKEREIVQLMRGLDLHGEDLERSEVPPAVLSAAQSSRARR